MIRYISVAGAIALASALSLSGCGQEASVKKVEKVQTPGGTTTTTTETTVESTGQNPPPNSKGQSVPPR